MSGVALPANFLALALPTAPAQVANEKASVGSGFGAVLSEVGQQQSGGAPVGNSSNSPAQMAEAENAGDYAAKSEDAPSLASASGRLSSINPASPSSSQVGGSTRKPRERSDDSSNNVSIEAALAALGYGAKTAGAVPSDAVAGAQRSASTEAGANAPTTGPATPASVVASLAGSTVAQSGTNAAAWDVSGNVPLKTLLGADSSLGLRSLQPRTHLTVASAASSRTVASERRLQAAGAIPSAPIAHGTAASPSFETDDQSLDDRARSSATGVSAAAAAETEADIPLEAPLSLTPDSAAGAPTSIALTQLPDFIADQAESLTPANSSSSPASTTKSSASQVVKELAIELDPADLGAVSLKMRLTNGKLSVVIGVSNSSTLAAIENERGAIALKLGANQQPLQDLIIRSQSVPTSQAEGQDATDLKDRNPSNSDSASQQGDNNGGSQTSRKGSSPPGASPSVLSGRALGDLLV